MATYVVGDVQGCFDELQSLMATVRFNAREDRVILLGDLVNRGPKSLEVLRWAYQQQDAVKIVLGNHDLHLLAVHAGAARQKGKDTLHAVLDAPDCEQLLTWLRQQPLLRQEQNCLLVHAGLLPCWSTQTAMQLAAEVEQVLSAANYHEFLHNMYGNTPDAWRDDLQGWDRLRMIVNSMTRLRLVTPAGVPDFRFKGELANAPRGLLPWFDAAGRRDGGSGWLRRIVFGHWSALGLLIRDDVAGLDTGCVWGRELSALRLDDDQVFQVRSLQPAHLEAD